MRLCRRVIFIILCLRSVTLIKAIILHDTARTHTRWNCVNNLRNRPYLGASSLLISSRVTANVLPGDVIPLRQLSASRLSRMTHFLLLGLTPTLLQLIGLSSSLTVYTKCIYVQGFAALPNVMTMSANQKRSRLCFECFHIQNILSSLRVYQTVHI